MESDYGKEEIFSMLGRLEKNAREADEIATKIGEKVGHVSPYTESVAREGSFDVRILVDINKYLELKSFLAQPGAVLAAVDIATLEVISLKVIGVSRADFYSMMGTQETLIPYAAFQDLRGLLTRPQILVEPLLAFKYQDGKLVEGKAFSHVIEPRSPVVLPQPKFIETLLGIRGEVVLGALTIGEEPLTSEGQVARALLPFEDLYYHTFVAGTTGSGKTTFLKNLIKSVLNLNQGASILCIDENGDYVQTLFDPRWDIEDPFLKEKEYELAKQLYGEPSGLREINILLPVTKSFVEDVDSSNDPLKELTLNYYRNYLRKLHQLAVQSQDAYYVYDVEDNFPVLSLKIPKKESNAIEIRKIKIIPYALNFSELKEKIADLYPYFTARARESFTSILEIFTSESRLQELKEMFPIIKSGKLKNVSVVSTLEELVNYLDEIERSDKQNKQKLADYARIHKETLDNLIRGLHNLKRMGIFDIKIGKNPVREPIIEEIIRENSLTVVDLRPLSMRDERLAKGAKRILTLRLLERILSWKMEKEFEQTPPVFVLVDEAHRFFPRSAVGEEVEYVEYVSGALERVARLGRVRRIGLILSTHSPKDVHSTVLNLCNNKVIFRLDPSLLEELGLPKDMRDFISKASDRIGLATSHALRLHSVTFKTSPPVLGHFKSRG
jgi:DNA helicase HerA-like ATPase